MLLDPTSTRLDTAVPAAPVVRELTELPVAADSADTPTPRAPAADVVQEIPDDLAALAGGNALRLLDSVP